MWPADTTLHYGLKAVYTPHPLYFDHDWPLEKFDATFNGGRYGSSGGNKSSSFRGEVEHNHRGSSWYCNSRFARKLWKVWFCLEESGRTTTEETSRMCFKIAPVAPDRALRLHLLDLHGDKRSSPCSLEETEADSCGLKQQLRRDCLRHDVLTSQPSEVFLDLGTSFLQSPG